jgi:hypothetical protein
MPEMEGERLILDEMLVEAAGVEPSLLAERIGHLV